VDGLLIFSCDGANEPYLAALDAKTGVVSAGADPRVEAYAWAR